MYNLPNIQNLTLDLTVLPLIYMGEIQYWNDDRIQKINPEVKMPEEKIIPVARAESAGQSEIFTGILGLINQTWRRLYWTILSPNFVNDECCNSTAWPSGVVQYFGVQVTGIVGLVTSIPYTIGYADLDSAMHGAATMANIRITSGKIYY